MTITLNGTIWEILSFIIAGVALFISIQDTKHSNRSRSEAGLVNTQDVYKARGKNECTTKNESKLNKVIKWIFQTTLYIIMGALGLAFGIVIFKIFFDGSPDEQYLHYYFTIFILTIFVGGAVLTDVYESEETRNIRILEVFVVSSSLGAFILSMVYMIVALINAFK